MSDPENLIARVIEREDERLGRKAVHDAFNDVLGDPDEPEDFACADVADLIEARAMQRPKGPKVGP